MRVKGLTTSWKHWPYFFSPASSHAIGVWLGTRAISLLLLISLLYNYVLHGYVVVFFHDVLGYSRENYWYNSAPYFVMLDRTYVEAMIVSLLFANASILLWNFCQTPITTFGTRMITSCRLMVGRY